MLSVSTLMLFCLYLLYISNAFQLKFPSQAFLKRVLNDVNVAGKSESDGGYGRISMASVEIGAESKSSSSTSMIDQRNVILLEKLQSAAEGNLTFVVFEYINFCDESFDKYLNEKIASLPTEEEKQKLGRVRYEINSARQNKLKVADNLLREILSAGGQSSDFQLKQMEAKLQMHMRKSEIDMAFMVILQLNIEDAINSNATMAVQIMQHMQTLIHEYQDEIVSSPVRLMRMLVREDDVNVRKQMLRQKLVLGDDATALKVIKDGETSSNVAEGLLKDDNGDPIPQDTESPQCMHIVVDAVKRWGGADVSVAGLEETIDDVLQQMVSFAEGGESQQLREEMTLKCETLKKELFEIVAEVDAPKVSDSPDDCDL